MSPSTTPRRFAYLALALACVLGAVRAAADEGGPRAPGVAWFDDLPAARKVAEQTGRPLFIALHRLPIAASPQAAARLAAWARVYRDPHVVEQSRAFACVLRVMPSPEGGDPDREGARSVTHIVLDGTQRVLLREDVGAPAPGKAGGRDFHTFLRRGLAAFGAPPSDAPLIDHGMVARTGKRTEGASPLRPVAVPIDSPGVRVRLRYDLPVPRLTGSEAEQPAVRARVSMRWDGAGPHPLQAITLAPGEEPDVPVDIRFADHEELAPLLTKGTHRLDLYLEPEPGSYPFSRGPLHVGRVWIELGDDGGGGGGGSEESPEPESPEEDEPEPPQTVPEGEQEQPEPPPPSDRTEVVEPFVREGDTIKKDDAVVAVEDPDSAVKPPRRVPLEEALRDFEKMKERAVGEERIAPRDRDFLRLYFDALARVVRGAAGAARKPEDGR